MSTIAEFSVPAAEFPLGAALADLPVDVEIERVAAYDSDRVMPYVWFSAPDADAFSGLDDRLAADPSVEAVESLTDLGDERLYRMGWVEDVALVCYALAEEGATLLDATGDRSRWRLRVLFSEREAVSRTYEFATEEGLAVEIRGIHGLEDDRHGCDGLTDAQHETLVAAFGGGYYEIPRDADMAALSDELGVSRQALSERLRRAHRVLVEHAVATGTEER
ncbi:helix-turn-helix domain-containing protein [Saliphagus infecundisoli]|uniref:Helix-turn-helix domain-containing protein n=1 Tax=Saliphagus infecundisoli TaxID=1849069 RepID=A0ABD5QG55_9EURY|nr:helix-turn-helix domain-containing protein [Saliphagus infecundisoli]